MRTPFDRRILWVHWQGEVVSESSIRDLAENIRQATPNVSGVLLKSNNGEHWQGTLDTKRALAVDGTESIRHWVEVLAERDLQTHLWCVVRGDDIAREAQTILQACAVPGVRSMLLNVESGARYFGGKQAADARNLITRVRAGLHPDFHLGLIFFMRDGYEEAIHFQEWLPYVQSLHPMAYTWEFSGGRAGPETYLDEIMGRLARYGLPVIPMLQTYPQPSPVPEDYLVMAANYAFDKGAVGVTLFRYGGDCSAEHILAAARRINPDQNPRDSAAENRLFRVQAARLRVRDEPGLKIPSAVMVEAGTIVEVDGASRTEVDGYVWWRSDLGWLAQGRVDHRHTLMIEITPGVPPLDLVTLAERTDTALTVHEPQVPQKRFRVLTKALAIRSQPEMGREFLTGKALYRGTEIVVDADAWTEQNGFLWWFHGAGWSAEYSSDSRMRFMLDLSPEVSRFVPERDSSGDPPPAPAPAPAEVALKHFRVEAQLLNIRSEPGLGRQSSNGVLRQGDIVQVRASAWLAKDGYVWWQVSAGWVVERSLDNRQRFMTDLSPDVARVEPSPRQPFPAPPPAIPPTPLGQPQRLMVVAAGVTICDEPRTDAIRLGRFRQGEVLLLEPSQRREADGMIWWRHERGWIAERSLDSAQTFMLNIDTLPLLGNLFQRHPVHIEETDWVQYYGNTGFAFRSGRYHNYHGFAQGLHSGLDYGKDPTNPANPPVFAGVSGVFDGRGLKYGPNRVDVVVGDYRIIYGHVGRPALLPRRTPVSPNAIMGVVESLRIHLHLEVRYREKYIINPLLLMPAAMVGEFMSRFPPEPDEFVETTTWKRWLSPLDQPIIRLGGEVIGPTAR